MTNHNPPSQIVQHALLDIEDRIARLQELLHLVTLAGEGLDEPQGTAIARGIQLAHEQSEDIKDAVMRAAQEVTGKARRGED